MHPAISRAGSPMTMLDDDVVETVDRPASLGKSRVARSTDRAAIAYLIASDATAISIIENESGCTFRVGTKIDPRSAAVYWLPEDNAKPVLKLARRTAGKSPDLATATAALIQAATDLKVTLTPHATARQRAGQATAKLNRYMDSLRGTGVLKE